MPRAPLPLGTWGDIDTRKIAPGSYEAIARYRDFDGVTRRIKRRGRTKSAATDALKETMRDRTGPTGDGELTADTRVNELLDVWWDEYTSARARPAGTIRRYTQVVDLHIRPAMGEWRLAECTVSKLDRLVKTKTEKAGYTNANIMVVLLSGAFDVATRHEAIASNPIRSIAPVPKPEHEITYFSLEDVAELRSILREWDEGLDKAGRRRVSDLADPVDMFLATGFRPGEVFATEWPDIDFTKQPVELRAWSTMAKNAEGRWDVQRSRKNHREVRLSLPRFAGQMLLRRRVNATSSLVFPSSSGTRRIPDNFRTQWHAALKGTRFEGRLPKEFRATVATHLRDSVGIEAAQHQLNHASLTTTEDRYAAPIVVAPDVSDVLERFVGPA